MKKERLDRGKTPKKKNFYFDLIDQIKKDKKAFIVYTLFRAVTVFVIVRNAIGGRWENCFVGFLALALFMIPPFVEKKFKLELPTVLEILAFSFVFCAEILGEIGGYYLKVPLWDTMLHTVNGFMFAAFGFCLVDILNKTKKFRFELSPAFMALVAFCFSITIGTLWEFFEFSADILLSTDMQKDFIVSTVSSVALNPSGVNTPIVIEDIIKTTVLTSSGSVTVIDGYLDVGIVDTMKDMFVNFIGALVFSIIGFFYIKHRGRGKVASKFIPTYEGNEE